MRTRLMVLVLTMTVMLGLGTFNSRAQVSFSAGIEVRASADFYEPLTPYGAWVEVGSHGRCWHPRNVERDWRPYCIGHWEWTDVGWYWVSDEPWAWACYHYGGWVEDPNYGWVWVPGTEWAPAWVTWREGGDYIGWAPCGPGGIALAPSLFVFVDLHHFRDHFQPSSVIVNNTKIINQTKRVGDFRRENRNFEGSSRRVVINEGPAVDPIQKATGQRFNRVPVQDIIRQTPAPTNLRRGEPAASERSRVAPEQPSERNTRPDSTSRDIRGRPLEPTGRPVAPSDVPGRPAQSSERERALPQKRPEAVPQEPNRTPSRERIEPPPSKVAPPEKPLPPTGRERGNERPQGNASNNERVTPREAPPAVRQAAPAKPAAPPAEPERGREKEKERPE